MIDLTMQIDWWIPLVLTFLVGLLTAFFTGISDAVKPRYELDADDKKVLADGKPVIKEKAGVVTKQELLETGDLCWKGAVYAVVIAGIVMILQLTPLQDLAYLWVVFGIVGMGKLRCR